MTNPSTEQIVDALRAAVKETERLRLQNQKLEAASREPLAIIGMGCRYPGGVRTPEDLWDVVAEGRDVVSGLPSDRGWDIDGMYDPDPDAIGKAYVRAGGFVDDVADFDAEFFGISPREARTMDPQQRLLLEASWEAIERAGVLPRALRGKQVGVFYGSGWSDYVTQFPGMPEEVEGYFVTGNTQSVISGRISYVLGLEGPAVTVDTACSSSLVALHLAGQALRAGECDLALAGGALILAGPRVLIEFSRQRALSRDGRCKAFSASADGFGAGEGVGVLLLERLSDARRNGHEVLAVVRGSAVNQDGASSGLTAPNGPSQERVIRAALANAGLSTADVDVVEAHGTGTSLGDPIEVQALQATYGMGRPADCPLWLGSVKSNIAHTQAAAGVAGVIKMVMALRHGVLPRTLHVDEPSPHIDWSVGGVRLLAEPQPWPATDRPRRAGVSSFGISGTNAHVILEQSPVSATSSDAPLERPDVSVVPWVLSGRSVEALCGQAERLAGWVGAHDGLDLVDVGFSLATTRSMLEQRAVVLGAGRAELVDGLGLLASGAPAGSVVRGVARRGARVVLVFPGQGWQWVGMAVGLLESSPVFAERIGECERALAPYVDWSLVEVLRGAGDAAGLLERVDVVQPVLWAVMVSLAEVWRSVGVVPAAVVGHSQGEIAAVCVAGGLSLEDAARVIALRSRALVRISGQGGMVSLAASAADAEELIAAWPGALSVAALNGPTATVVSGDAAALDELLSVCGERGVRARRLPVSYAAHSGHVDVLEGELLAALAPVVPVSSRVPFFSTVTGDWLDTAGLDGAYWFRNLREPVGFAGATRALLGQGFGVFVEASAHPVLANSVLDMVEESAAGASVVGTLRRDEGGWDRFLVSVAEAWTAGVGVDWSSVLVGGRRVGLPTYAFARRRYWVAGSGLGLADPGAAGVVGVDHPLLGVAVSLAGDGGLVLTGRLSVGVHGWLADHVVAGVVVLPGAAFVELAVRAGDEVGCGCLDELTLQAPLVVADDGVDIQVRVGAEDVGGCRSVGVSSRVGPDGGWVLHAEGVLSSAVPSDGFDLGVWPPVGAVPVDLSGFYERLAESGYGYGPAFQGLRAVWRRGGETFAEVVLPEQLRESASRFGLHPALLDAALHAGLAVDDGGVGVRLPFSWNGVSLFASGAAALRVRLVAGGEGAALVEVADVEGRPVARVERLVARPVSTAGLRGAGVGRAGLYGVDWVPVAPAGPAAAVSWSVYGESVSGPVEVVVLPFDGQRQGVGVAEGARVAVGRVLEVVQGWLGDESVVGSRLLVVTRNAVAVTGEDGVAGLAGAGVWGLVRSAQSEQPDRFLLLDVDEGTDWRSVLDLVLATGEPQVAVRGGVVLVPRLVRVPAVVDGESGWAGAGGTVLVTGGTGALGALLIRHLVATGGVRRVVATSRRGLAAPGAEQLVAEVAALGAELMVVACDVVDRGQVDRLVAQIPAEYPLVSVIHAAGVLDDGVIGSLTVDRLDAVLRPKVDAAINLHEATARLDLRDFVLFSSVAGVIGSPGQGNYAAANAFLDALAQHRRAAGLPAVSMAWGPWQQQAGMIARLKGADRDRLFGTGVAPLSEDEGLELFDAATTSGHRALLVPMRLDLPALRVRAASGDLPTLLKGLVSAATRRPAAAAGSEDGGSELLRRLVRMPEPEQERYLLDLVRTHAAATLGHSDRSAIDPHRGFSEMSFDSLMSVQLRNRISTVVGLRLPSTLLFDQPTPTALARHLKAELTGAARPVDTGAAGAAVAGDEPLAIIGMSCRLPGGIRSPEDLWQLLVEGHDAVSPVPEDRGWDIQHLYDPDPAAIGKTYCLDGGFVDNAADFDAELFGISPREALAMDPQQRFLLEACWEAFERAGLDINRLRGTNVGVFAGAMSCDYLPSARKAPAEVEGYTMTGTSGSVVSGRIAYAFGLEGPALTVDTACSSSLVALHLAAQALRNGDCSLALAGGVTIMSGPREFIEFSRQRGLSPDGRCKAFAAAADGVGQGEGVAVLVVERLSDAQRLGHHVLALVRGSAVNQDGASSGLTAPNGPSQQRVIRAALGNARLRPADIDAVEAHGTGTRLGDPIEAQALLATYGQDRPEDRPLWLGSVKSNIAHSQAAAGAVGVIKMVMAMRHGELPRTLHVDSPTPHVDWSAGGLALLTEAQPWPDTGRPRRAGVSSFGISGTNAHVILESVANAAVPDATGPNSAIPNVAVPGAAGPNSAVPNSAGATADPARPDIPVVPWVLSARTAGSLAAQAARLYEYITRQPGLDPVDVGFSLATTRAALEHRAVLLGDGRDALVASLAALSAGRPAEQTAQARTGTGTAFLFSGQGAQRAGMGAQLAKSYPVFADAFATVCEALDLAPAVFDDAAALAQTQWTQTALFAFEVALFRLLESWGVRPDILIGHSIGELAAAHVAGVFTLEDAAKLVTARGRLMQALPDNGGMVAVQATEDEARAALAGHENLVSVAAVNSPRSVVLSGEMTELDAVLSRLDGRRTRRLTVSHAFHSPLMDAMLADFAKVAESIGYAEPQIPLVSNVTGRLAEAGEHTEPSYWVRHVRDAVRFGDGVQALLERGIEVLLELGPSSVLTTMAQETLDSDESDALVVPLVRKDRAEPESLLAALAAAYTRGVDVDWAALLPGGRVVDLPTYAFQHRRYWLNDDATAVGDADSLGLGDARHPLLAGVIRLADDAGVVLTGRLSLRTHPWLADHSVAGTVLLSGTALVEMALRAADEVGCGRVEELTQQRPFVIPEQGYVTVQVRVEGDDGSGRRPVSIHSRGTDSPDGVWLRHAAGFLSDGAPEVEANAQTGQAPWPPDRAESVDLDGLYDRLAASGYEYGPAFRGLRRVWRQGAETLAEVELSEGEAADAGRFGIHPALLDAALHAMLLPKSENPSDGAADDGGGEVRLPFLWTGVSVTAYGVAAARVRLVPTGSDAVSLHLTDADGRLVATVAALTSRPVPAHLLRAGAAADGARYEVRWTPAESDATAVTDAAVTDFALHGGGSAATAPFTVLPVLTPHPGDLVAAVHESTASVLRTLQTWLDDPGTAGSRLVIVTCGAVAADATEHVRDLTNAAIWGLVRSAQLEAPDRFVLVDVEGHDGWEDSLRVALATRENQIAVRGGRALVPRLARDVAPAPAGRAWDPDGTVLITGGTGSLGRVLARHLVAEHGVKSLLLTSRRGADAPGARELCGELELAGARVTLAACDVADQQAVAELVATIPPDRPLTAVVHTAGVLDDGVIGSLTRERLDTVLVSKVDAVLSLREATRGADIAAFVLFSSTAGVFGGPGQGNYAAANSFLDAFATHLVAEHIPAVSLAWGPWEQAGGMTGHLADRDRVRMARTGLDPLTVERALALFDEAVAGATASPLVMPLRVNERALRAQAEAGTLPAVLNGLVRRTARRSATAEQAPVPAADLVRRLADLSEDEQERLTLDLVRAQVAGVLGHDSPNGINPSQSFQALGFDSLTALELRNRLGAACGLRLPATLIFDHPSPAVLAAYVCARLRPERIDPAERLLAELDSVEAALLALDTDDEAGKRITKRLRAMTAKWTDSRRGSGSLDGSDGQAATVELKTATADELLNFIDQGLGRERGDR